MERLTNEQILALRTGDRVRDSRMLWRGWGFVTCKGDGHSRIVNWSDGHEEIYTAGDTHPNRTARHLIY